MKIIFLIINSCIFKETMFTATQSGFSISAKETLHGLTFYQE